MLHRTQKKREITGPHPDRHSSLAGVLGLALAAAFFAYVLTATERSRKETTADMLFYYDSKLFRIVYNKAMGMSLRCVRGRP